MFNFFDFETILGVAHLFGVAIGAGGAFFSDAMFFRTTRDERINSTEMKFLTLGSRFVFLGLAVLVLTGVGSVFLEPAHYLDSDKFLAKMTIVGVILVNGAFLHRYLIPILKRHVGHHFPSSDEFARSRVLLLSGGAVSMVSWASALILGAVRHVPFSYLQIIGVYLGVVALGLLGAVLLKEVFLPSHKKVKRRRGRDI